MGKWLPVAINLDQPGIVAAYKAGMATSDIMAKFGGSRDIILKILKRHRIVIIHERMPHNYIPHNKKPVDDKELRRLHALGKSTSEIAKAVQHSKTLVYQRLRSMGLLANKFLFGTATNLKSMIGEKAFNALSDRDWLY